MLLRRTRADQVARHLPSVMQRFPTPQAMARARLATVERVLRPFGLVWRARNLRASAEMIVRDHHGLVPTDHDALLNLPGVGAYVAAAVVSVTDNRDVVLVDTNTVRVAKRVAGLQLRGDVRRRADVRRAIETLIGGAAPASDWWGVIDLASAICRPTAPRCEDCPIASLCEQGLATGTAAWPRGR